ncbi:MAG TPA: hypothetical protein VJY41_05180 [Prolixibacteraceae bacterium]|nr:hypothetical protein [Prolixibacteraceae bacterium]
MKKLLLTAIVGLLVAITGNAQPQGGRAQFNPEEMIKRQTEQMVADLDLSKEQIPKVEAINKKYSEKTQLLFQNGDGDRSKSREKMETLRNEKNVELKTVLTKAQYTKFIELEEKRMQERRQRMEERGGNQTPSKRGAPRDNAN